MPTGSPPRWLPWPLIAAVVAALVSIAVLWTTTLPLGVPGEWVWERLPADAQTPANLILAAMGAALYLGFVILGDRRLSSSSTSKMELLAWLSGLAFAAFGWLWTVQDTAPTAGQLGKAPFILFYPGSSGYFTHTRYEVTDANQLLRGYEDFMRKGDVLHQGTHPPGLFLVFHGLIAFVDSQPWLISALQATEPESVRDAFEIVAENSARTQQPLTPPDRAVLWLATLLAMTATAATVWPLYALLRVTTDRSIAWVAAAAWPAVPAAAMFLPKSDAVFPFVACCALVALTGSVRQRSLWRGVVAGLVLFLGLFASLAFLPVMLFGALATLAVGIRRAGWKSALWEMGPTIGGVAIGLAIPVILTYVVWGMNMLTVWGWNYHNHAGFYAQFPRTYWKWLLLNPVELSLALGAPVAMGALWGLPREKLSAWSRADVMIVLAAGVWCLLWVSGKNAGEAARLWVLLMPGAVKFAAVGWQRSECPLWVRWTWLALQLTVCIATVHRVAGFHFG
jgi:methylthioxylose transferase